MPKRIVATHERKKKRQSGRDSPQTQASSQIIAENGKAVDKLSNIPTRAKEAGTIEA